LPTTIDTTQISDEISNILKRIGEKRKRVETVGKRETKIRKKIQHKDISCESQDKILQIDKDMKCEHIIDINDLIKTNKNHKFSNTDVVFTLIEIAVNSNYYYLGQNNRSISFWENALNFKVFRKIFELFKAATLKKYWLNVINNGDPIQIADFIKKNKNLFDTYNVPVLPIISTALEYFNNKITNLEDYIKNLPGEANKIENEIFEKKDFNSIKLIKDKHKTFTSHKRNRYELPNKRIFTGRNYANEVSEIIEGYYFYLLNYFRKKNIEMAGKPTTFQEVINKIDEEEGIKLK